MSDLVSLDSAIRTVGCRFSLPSSKPTWFERSASVMSMGAYSILANLMIALRAAPELADAFTFDDMVRTALKWRSNCPSCRSYEACAEEPLPRGRVRHTDKELKSGCSTWNAQIGRETTYQTVDLRAQENSFTGCAMLRALIGTGDPGWVNGSRTHEERTMTSTSLP